MGRPATDGGLTMLAPQYLSCTHAHAPRADPETNLETSTGSPMNATNNSFGGPEAITFNKAPRVRTRGNPT